MGLKGKLIAAGGVMVGVALVGLSKMINNKSVEGEACVLNTNINDNPIEDIIEINEEVAVDDNKEDYIYYDDCEDEYEEDDEDSYEEEDYETYEEYLMRTGLEDTEQNYQMFMAGY